MEVEMILLNLTECDVFTLTELHHKQHYYRTASFLYRDPTSPHSC